MLFHVGELEEQIHKLKTIILYLIITVHQIGNLLRCFHRNIIYHLLIWAKNSLTFSS